ncbi:MAG: DegV family protein [Anaeromicrobium sp.]|uniref:DegV family protein n=1 Tax=Anaeromicrobium sp. TaxID=1929132 RepID=UPI0025F6E660|nr:DegV family protein [Anaeromicrobium sp.]MCT4593506.1 DegV family protein [Anaeromicrobium sp.]
MNIKIITDSLSDIPKESIKKYDICVLPLKVRFKEVEYEDQVTITTDEFFEKLEKSEELPKTAQVIPSEYIEKIEKYLKEGYEIIIINGSSKVSGTHQSALIAKEETDPEKVHVIDTLSLSYGCGIIAVEAAKMAKEGKGREEIIQKVNEMIDRVEVLFSVETLDYLKKGGRLSSAKALIGNLLNVKPILHIRDGEVEVIEKVRGSKKIVKKMIDLSKSMSLEKNMKSITILHGQNEKSFQKLKDEVKKELKPKEILESRIGPTIGTYTGPSLIAIVFMK